MYSDAWILTANARRMIARAHYLGVGLRPHLKTLKSIDTARLAIDPGHGGIAAATLSEAAFFAGHGLQDIQLAVCLPPARFPRVAEILHQAPRFSFFIDSTEVARAASDCAKRPSPRRSEVFVQDNQPNSGGQSRTQPRSTPARGILPRS
jgi:D-serine deaminase-like pyridoxal phosphate-dependent protein